MNETVEIYPVDNLQGLYNDEAEKAVLGTLLNYPEAIVDTSLTESDFGTQNHRMVYSSILTVDANEAVDVITVSDHLEKQTGRNWLSVVGEMADYGHIKSKNIKHYAELVKQASIARRSTAICQELIERVVVDGESAVDNAIRELMGLSAVKKKYDCSIQEALRSAVDRIDEAFTSDGGLVGVSTGLVDIDEATGGFHPSDLVVIGARAAMGKTALVLNMASGCNVPCGFISGEQSRDQVGSRMIAINGLVSAHRMRTGKLVDDDWPRITAGSARANDFKMWINDKGSPTIDDVRRQARIWHHNYNLQILYVDYLQKIIGLGNSPREKVIDVTQGLKDLAKELDIPVVPLAQINRDVEKRPDKRPHTSDLLESGIIEQEADVIIMLYRDEVYNPDTTDKGSAEMIFRKNRHGPIGTIRTTWRGEFMRFENAENNYYQDQYE